MAMPISAAASAGASLTPSPTIATTVPPARAGRDTASPCRPAAPRRCTRVDAELRAPTAPAARAVVAGQHHRRDARALAAPRSPPRRPARAHRRRRCSAEQPLAGTVATTSQCAPCAFQRSAARLRARSMSIPCSRQQPRAAEQQLRAPSTVRRDAAAGQGAERVDAPASRPPASRRPARRAPADARCPAARRRPGASSASAASPRRHRSPVTAGWPSVSVPVLSNTTSVTPCARSSASASRIRMPARAADARAGHDRGRRRQAQRAGAGDHQHRDRVQHRRLAHRRRSATSRATSAAPCRRPRGTKTALTRSTSRCTGALAAWRRLDQRG